MFWTVTENKINRWKEDKNTSKIIEVLGEEKYKHLHPVSLNALACIADDLSISYIINEFKEYLRKPSLEDISQLLSDIIEINCSNKEFLSLLFNSFNILIDKYNVELDIYIDDIAENIHNNAFKILERNISIYNIDVLENVIKNENQIICKKNPVYATMQYYNQRKALQKIDIYFE